MSVLFVWWPQVGFALFGAALAVCALCGLVIMSHSGSAELMEVRLPNGRMAKLVPVQQLQQHRMQQLFGPGDLPMPIEDDGMPGGNDLTSRTPYLSPLACVFRGECLV